MRMWVSLGRAIGLLGLNVNVVSVLGGPHVHVEAYVNYLAVGISII